MNEYEFLFFVALLWGLTIGAMWWGLVPLSVSSGLALIALLEWEKRR